MITFVSPTVYSSWTLGQYGLEFGIDLLVATGLAQTAIHKAVLAQFFPYSAARGDNAPASSPSTGPGRQPFTGPSLLETLRQICDSETLASPLPYDPKPFISQRIQAITEGPRAAEILRICQQYTLSIPNDASQEELDARLEELIWAGTLLLFATGREGREVRLDFFLMHLVTSSLFLGTTLDAVKDTRSKVALIRHYVPVLVVVMLSRGRPTIRANLVQEWTETPRPVGWDEVLGIKRDGGSGIGDMRNDEDYNPWPALTHAAMHHPDLHVVKAMRTLIFAARKYGDVPPGGVIGAFRPAKATSESAKPEETFKGMAELDGTLFVRAAGAMMDYMRWTVCGHPARPDWDRSALGWDEAWANKN